MATNTPPQLYTETPDAANASRARYLEQVQALIEQRQDASAAERRASFNPDSSSVAAYEKDIEPLRERFRAMLGFPLIGAAELACVPAVREEPVATDALGSISRIYIEALPGYEIYGLLFMPHGEKPARLVISQHGGEGTPEVTAGFFDSANYNDMTRRILRRGFAVFAPQLLLWRAEFGPKFDRNHIDWQLKQLGGSITALELFGLSRCLDSLLARPDILSDGAGICGLSYGGFYALFLAAVDTRIKAAVSSCFVNDRLKYNWQDWTWFNAANSFLDAEIAALVCPRPLFIEVGDSDTLFDAGLARPVLDEIAGRYRALGLGDSFEGRIFGGGHEFATSEHSLDFLVRHLEPLT